MYLLYFDSLTVPSLLVLVDWCDCSAWTPMAESFNLPILQTLHWTRQICNGPQTSNLSQQQLKKIWPKIIFEQNQKKFQEQNFGKNKILGKFLIFFWKIKIWKKKFWKKFFKIIFLNSSTIPAHPAHPVQISSRSDYCMTLS